MKKTLVISAVAILLAGYCFIACKQERQPPEKAIAALLITQVDSFSRYCQQLDSLVSAAPDGPTRALTAKPSSPSPQPTTLQQTFLQARLAYKRIEWATEYFEPATSRFVNGAPVQEVELSGQVFEPSGLQVIEALLYPNYDPTHKQILRQQLQQIQMACDKYRTHFGNIDIFDWQVFDATKQEIFRIMTLGITGFDNPLTLNSMNESAASLGSLKQVMSYYDQQEAKIPNDSHPEKASPDQPKLVTLIDTAIAYLHQQEDFNHFDRAQFITQYCNPLTIQLSDLEQSLQIQVIRYNRLLNQDAKTLFDTNAFNINAYVPDMSLFATPEKIALGRLLFADPSLSSTGTRSCQSCHQPGRAFTDGLVKNAVLGNEQLLRRNTPTLLNAALQPTQFYDSRVTTLEDQARTVVQNKEEMHGSMAISAQRLWADTTYRKMFETAFPKKDRNNIDTMEIMNALGSYVRSLVALNSRFDQYMRGNYKALNVTELQGFNLFMGKAKCATCHYMPLFNGTFPPRFIKIETEVIGVPSAINGHQIDADPGRYEIVKVTSFQHAFKTPTLRNASRTAPYMHNGVFTTLEEVLDFYNKGGGRGLGIKVENQTLPFDKLDLSGQEQQAIIAFIRSLDSQ